MRYPTKTLFAQLIALAFVVGSVDAQTGTEPRDDLSRFLANPEHVPEVLAIDGPIEPAGAEKLGLVTFAFDDLDWEDDVRVAIEERASFSPDSLTGMEANLRFAGPETLESKIFGRLTAWQNWIFQRPNAVGEAGALKLYGSGVQATFDKSRV